MEMDVNIMSSSQRNTSGDVFQDDSGSEGSVMDVFDEIDVEDSLPDAPSEWSRPAEPLPSTSDDFAHLPQDFSGLTEDAMEVVTVVAPCMSRGPPLLLRRTAEEERLDESLARLREGTNGERNFGHYMQLKKDKLRYQVNVVSRVTNVVSNIFEGVSIFVNGHTGILSHFLFPSSDPPALELRELIQTHGGEYHCYMEYGVTTYTVATGLASVKVDKTRKNEIFILPSWIVDCIASGSRLPVDEYLLIQPEKEKHAQITKFFGKPAEEENKPKEQNRALDARDPNFLQEFYSRSRLHLISTLAQDMKDFMASLRESGHSTEEEWQRVEIPDSGGRRLTEPVVFHVDLDCFFVSVGLRNRPELKHKPVAITHSKGSTAAPGFSEIASCSYSARRLGLRNGMLVRDALKLCPSLVCLPYQFEDYRTVSKTIYTLISSFTLEVRAVSCDEMYINFTKSCQQRGIVDVTQFANHIRARIKAETGCPASVGIGPNMLIARLSTRKAKPNGVHWTRKQDVAEFVAQEKIENLPGVGYYTLRKLKERFGELETCSDLQNIDSGQLGAILGKTGVQIYKQCRGEDDSLKDFLRSTERKSVSCDINYGIRFTQREELLVFLRTVAEEVERKLIMCRRLCQAVTLKLMIRSQDAPVETAKYLGHGKCDFVNKTNLLRTPSNCQNALFSEIVHLFDAINPNIPDLRGIGVHCGRLSPLDSGVRKAAVKRDFFERKSSTTLLDEKKAKTEESSEDTEPDQLLAPSFRDATTPASIKMEIKAFLLEEPSDSNVAVLLGFLKKTLLFGAFSSLRQYALVLARRAISKDIDHRWFTAVHTLFIKLDNILYLNYGARMIEPELRKNPFLKEFHFLCNNDLK